ncbi:MAG: DUF1365 domain-containing protein [Alphaproteobacteria bacterium]
MRSTIYRGHVVHQRLQPVRHHFRYRVFGMVIDLDELDTLHRRLRLFSVNRFNLFGFHYRDHGDKTVEHPADWARRRLAEHGLADAGAHISLLCFPRLFGYVFNPLSVYFCRNDAGALAAIIYEVHNTFGERHSYVLPAAAGADGRLRQACDKAFYVSPFIEMAARYEFHLTPPDARFSLFIREYGGAGEILRAAWTGTRAPLTDRELLRCFFAYPLMSLKVIASIHWHAFRLWRKGARYYAHRIFGRGGPVDPLDKSAPPAIVSRPVTDSGGKP